MTTAASNAWRVSWRGIRRGAGLLVPFGLVLSTIAWGGSGEVPFEIASGPFEVAGSPEAFSVAWVDNRGEVETLWLRVQSRAGSSRLHLVAGELDREAGILLDASPTRVVVAWKSAGVWNVGELDPRDEAGGSLRSHRLPAAGRLLSVALREDDVGLVALLQDDPAGPARLVEIDLADGSSRTLHQFTERVVASALRAVGNRIAVAWTDRDGGLELRILDSSGLVVVSRKLNVFPVAALGPRIGRFEDTLTVAWVERLPDGLASWVGSISADGTLRILDTSGHGDTDPAGRIVPSQGDGRLLVLESDSPPHVTSLLILDRPTGTTCGSVMQDPEPAAGSWLLGSPEDAVLFRSRDTGDGRLSLTSLPLRCSSEMAAEKGMDGGGGTILGGSEDPCDGYDDDGDGIVDNGCDRVCDAPEVALGPLDFVDEAWQSSGPVVVRAGSEFGVAFYDSRGSFPGIYFARMDETGAKIYERRITADNHVARSPTLVWTGSQFGLAWEDFSAGRYEIFVSILNSDGSNSTSPRQVSDVCSGTCPGQGGQEPSIGWRGSEYGVVFRSDRNGTNDLFFARLQPTGVKIGVDRLVRGGGDCSAPSLVWAGPLWGVAWQETLTGGEEEIYFTRVDTGGYPETPQRITNAAGFSGFPSLVWSGSEYGLSWQDARISGNEIYFARLDSTGSKIGADVRLTVSFGSAYAPSLGWTGEEFVVSWHDTRGGNRDVYTARVSSAGIKQGGDLRISTPPAFAGFTSLAWSGTSQVVVWEDNDDGVWGVHTAFVRCCDDMDGDGYTECAGDPNDQDAGSYPGGPDACDGRDNNGNGTVDEFCDGLCAGPDNRDADLRVSDGGAGAYSAAIAWNGSEFGVAWGQTLTGPSLWFRRLDADGQPIGPPTSVIAGSSVHALVWNGTEYGLLANDSTGSMLVRLDATGNLIGSTTFDAMTHPVMVWNGSEYAVVTDAFLFYRIDAAGNQIGQPVDLGITGVFPYPDLAWNGTGYGLVYARGVPYFQRVDVNGALVGGEIALSSDVAHNPSIVWTGSEYGVAWDYTSSGDGIRFVRLDANGAVQGTETTVTSTAGRSAFPVVRWTGQEYGVAWQDDRYGLDYIFFRRLTAAGANIGTVLRAMDPASTDARDPALVWNGTDYGVVSRYIHTSSTTYETWFQRIRCCGQNGDGDPYGKCDDCDDQNPDVHPFAPQICDGLNNDCYDPAWPLLDGTNEVDLDGDTQSECAGDCDENDITVYTGAPELCDLKDNDCDTVVDEGFPVPETSNFTLFDDDKETIEWAVAEFADRYDLVRGDLGMLRSTGGDFRVSVDTCVRDDAPDTAARDAAVPPVGGGFHYLVRAQAACKDGSYDSGGKGQVDKRDDEIEESANGCP